MKRSHQLPHDWFPEPLPANVVVGHRSWVYSSFAFRHYSSLRDPGVAIGDDTGVYNGCFFELGASGQVLIGNFCSIVGAIINTNRRVTIRDYAFIAHEVVIADSFCATPVQPESGDREEEDSVIIGENAWIGTRAILLRGARIGRDSIVGAGAVIDGIVPDGAVAAGNPYRILRH